jgi:hypothetical protein
MKMTVVTEAKTIEVNRDYLEISKMDRMPLIDPRHINIPPSHIEVEKIRGRRFVRSEINQDGKIFNTYDRVIGWPRDLEDAIGTPMRLIDDLSEERYNLQVENFKLRGKIKDLECHIFCLNKTIKHIRDMPIVQRIFNFIV